MLVQNEHLAVIFGAFESESCDAGMLSHDLLYQGVQIGPIFGTNLSAIGTPLEI